MTAATPIGAAVTGTGMYVPERILTNADLERMVETSDEWIRTRTGIRERRIAPEGTHTATLATEAGRRALASAGLDAAELDLIIVATCTPDAPAPSTACVVQQELGAVRAAAFDLAAGCSGFVYALATAAQFVRAGVYRQVLVIGAEVLSRVVNWQDRNTCVLFGDGAGAAVVSALSANGITGVELGADGTGADVLGIYGGPYRPHAQLDSVSACPQIYMEGQEVFKFATRICATAAERSLDAAGIGLDGLGLLIPHQANWRIIHAAAKRLHLRDEQVFVNVDRYGNTSGASVGIALAEAAASGRIAHGDAVVLVGFGAGLTWAALTLIWQGGTK